MRPKEKEQDIMVMIGHGLMDFLLPLRLIFIKGMAYCRIGTPSRRSLARCRMKSVTLTLFRCFGCHMRQKYPKMPKGGECYKMYKMLNIFLINIYKLFSTFSYLGLQASFLQPS